MDNFILGQAYTQDGKYPVWPLPGTEDGKYIAYLHAFSDEDVSYCKMRDLDRFPEWDVDDIKKIEYITADSNGLHKPDNWSKNLFENEK